MEIINGKRKVNLLKVLRHCKHVHDCMQKFKNNVTRHVNLTCEIGRHCAGVMQQTLYVDPGLFATA